MKILSNGKRIPYPNKQWNYWDGQRGPSVRIAFVCVQSLYVDDNDFLWVLDTGKPGYLGKVIPGGAKLVGVDLKNDQIQKVIYFDEQIAPKKSYLNDVRINTQKQMAYITDSGLEAIIVTNLQTGISRRLLADHPSTKAEPGYIPQIEGRSWRTFFGYAPRVHSDGVALDLQGEYLYYHVLTGENLYRIPLRYLEDPQVTQEERYGKIENLGSTSAIDGMAMDSSGNLYLAAIEKNAILRRNKEGVLEVLVRDPQIQWPDSIAIGKDGFLYFTISQIHLTGPFNWGFNRRKQPDKLFKIPLEKDGRCWNFIPITNS